MKTGNTYKVIANAINEADLVPVVVYAHMSRGEPETIWVRPLTDFGDGRFVEPDHI